KGGIFCQLLAVGARKRMIVFTVGVGPAVPIASPHVPLQKVEESCLVEIEMASKHLIDQGTFIDATSARSKVKCRAGGKTGEVDPVLLQTAQLPWKQSESRGKFGGLLVSNIQPVQILLCDRRVGADVENINPLHADALQMLYGFGDDPSGNKGLSK